MASLTSKISSKAQTVLPRAVREKLNVGPGDSLSYRMTRTGIVIEKLDSDRLDPFADWWEWATPENEAAFAHLQPGYVEPK